MLDPNAFSGQVFMRTDGTSTVQLNSSELTGGPDAPQAATFGDASTDGERAFFMSTQALTDDAPADGTNKLYMYDTTKPGSDLHNVILLSVMVSRVVGTRRA